jgi:hypothetical protein
MPARNLLSVLVLAATLTGCAAGATAAGMTLKPEEAVKPANPRMAGTVGVEVVGGGEETNPLWSSQVSNDEFKQALLASLKLAGLLADGPARYSLKVALVKLDQPTFGFDMTVTATVQYAVTDAASGAAVWSEKIETRHTATVGEAFAGVTRLKLANEGAVRKNIAQLVQKLGAAPLPGALGVN